MIVCQYMDVVLREFEESDVPKKVEWINNPENNRFLHYELPLKVDKTVEWFRNKDNTKRLDCVIEHECVPVGLIGLMKIDRKNLNAEYYIALGEKSHKQKGVATKATKAILEYAFTVLKLRKVYLTVDLNNERAIHLYEKVGFKQEGYFADDQFYPQTEKFIIKARHSLVNNGGQFCKVNLLYTIENPFKVKEFYEDACQLSPVQRLGEYKESYLWIKREDLLPFSFGGNKARKAQMFFKVIDIGNYDCVVTYGSGSSNHCRIIANACCRRGLDCYIISPEEASASTFNSQIMELFGAEIMTVPVSAVHDTIEQKLSELRDAGKHPYFIEGGGHGDIGTEAYFRCYSEIKKYEELENVHFDYIFFASGTGTTQAGLVCGQLINGDTRKIVGISVARKNPRGRNIVLDSIRSYLEGGTDTPISDDAICAATIFLDDYTDGYGHCDERITETMATILRQFGIPLDATYTGKAFMGMTEYLQQLQIKGKNILFVHTGGTPLFFDAIDKMKQS